MLVLNMMIQHWIISVIVLLFGTLSLGEERPIIETSLGKIKGHYKISHGGGRFAAYEGIPYAKPPIGNMRFEEPIEAEPWTAIWDATRTHTCLQLSWPNYEPIGSEDCLYLNVYVPDDGNVDTANLDVIVHIHGGAFMMGDPNLGSPDYLMDRNITYVNINYRLGALGFLSTADDVVPGNNGMKDQVLALRWVQKHIERFGGNPNSVTLTGLSAGAGSVHLHYFSPLTKGLFHQGMSQGGTALAAWVVHKSPLKQAKRLAASIGCDNSCTSHIIKCLKQRSARQVIQNSYSDLPTLGVPMTPFSPVIEKKSSGAFLTDDPYKLLKSGNIHDAPWLTGATTDEGSLVVLGLKNFDDINNRWETVLPYVLNYYDTVDEKDMAAVAQEIKRFYLDNKVISDDNVKSFIKLFGDRFFHLDLEKSARLQAKIIKSPVYSYIYGYRAELDPIKAFAMPKDYGVGHGSDAQLLYKMKFGGISITTDEELPKSDERIKEFLLDAVTSFARYGQPKSSGITWEQVKHDGEFKHLFIHNDGIKMASKSEIAPTEFWQSLPLREYDNAVLKRDEL